MLQTSHGAAGSKTLNGEIDKMTHGGRQAWDEKKKKEEKKAENGRAIERQKIRDKCRTGTGLTDAGVEKEKKAISGKELFGGRENHRL